VVPPNRLLEEPQWRHTAAVLDELYHRMASQPVTQKGTGIELQRGQWAISYEQLAKASGATK
jgi:hypothetical protein